MLQTSAIQYEANTGSVDFAKFLSPRYYLDLVKRRALYFLIPFLLIAPTGAAIVMLLPALYSSEGKLLVESQRIPTELVRPTVTSLAAERIQIMQQRLMTRDNMMSLIEKYKLFSDRRNVLSNTELVDLMRERTRIKPLELGRRAPGADRITMALTVGFEHEQPDISMKVASELITLILNEDLRNRTSRASETTQFLAREAGRLQSDLRAVDMQIAEVKRTRSESAQAALARQQAALDQVNLQIANLKAERLTKANQLSWNHPDVQAIQRRITGLERSLVSPPAAPSTDITDPALEALETQQTTIQKNLEAVSQKLSAARLGEALERDQQAEKLEVIEQPSRPQQPIKPKRVQLLALVFGLALFAGLGLAVVTEAFDTTVRSRADLLRLVESHIVLAIPYVETQRDTFWRRVRVGRMILIGVALLVVIVVAGYFFLPPLDVLWEETLVKLPRYLNR